MEPGKTQIIAVIFLNITAKTIYSALKIAAVPKCVQSYVIDVQRRFERGNYNADGLDNIVFLLDWVINILVRYSAG